MRSLIASIFILLLSGKIFASEEPTLLFDGGLNSLLVGRDSFAIVVDDQVSDGCLPQPSALKDRLEIALRKNNFGIQKEVGFFTNDIHVNALGYQIGESSSCAVFLEAFLVFQVFATAPFSENEPSGKKTIAPYFFRIGSSLFTGNKQTMQGRLEDEMKSVADAIFLKVSRAEDDIFEKFPAIKDKFTEVRNTKENQP